MMLSAPIHQLKRRARRMARDENIALREALDRVAQEEGFVGWSLLASRLATDPPSKALLSRLAEGDLLVLGARPGHGKTLLGFQLLLDAARAGRKAVFFTLEYTEGETRQLIRSLEGTSHGDGDKLAIVTSQEISADFMVRHLSGSPRGTVAVIDYLQILDQQRSKLALSNQMLVLQDFARQTGAIFGFISQIDRSYVSERGKAPGLRDIRLPNPVDLTVFSKACFLHDGKVEFQEVA